MTQEKDFQDNFSTQAETYAKARPTYPTSLYEFIVNISPGRERAWDCATGNGQAAVALADYFKEVIATDASADQLAYAQKKDNVHYAVATAEHSGLPDQSVDVITVATALHWFKLEEFYAEAKRVLKPRGILAAWGYFSTTISPEVDAVVHELSSSILHGYWASDIRKIANSYQTIPFPFTEIETPHFAINVEMTFDQMVQFIHTWSATQKFIAQNGYSPANDIREKLKQAWGDTQQTRNVCWPLALKVGRV